MSMEWLWRFAGRAAGPRDGAGLDLDTLLPEAGASLVAAPGVPESRAALRSRRRDTIEEHVAAKVLGAHLANRHQISYPLTLDFRSLSPAEAAMLVDMASAAIAADGEPSSQRLERAGERLRRVGAGEAELHRLRAGEGATRPTGALAAAALACDKAAHAYAVSLLVAGERSPVSQIYLAYLAARLGLTQQVIGSLNRRFRG